MHRVGIVKKVNNWGIRFFGTREYVLLSDCMQKHTSLLFRFEGQIFRAIFCLLLNERGVG